MSTPRSTHEEPRRYPSRVPRRTVRRSRAPPGAAAGWPRLPRPAKPNGMSKLQSPAKKARERIAACGVCTETCGPPRVGACLTMAWQRRCVNEASCAPDGRSLGCKRRQPVRPPLQPGPHTPLRGRAWLLLGCVARTPATACGVGVHLAGHGGGVHLLWLLDLRGFQDTCTLISEYL